MSRPLDFCPSSSRTEQDLAWREMPGHVSRPNPGPIFPDRPFDHVGGHVQPVSLRCQLPEVSRFVAISPIRFHPMN